MNRIWGLKLCASVFIALGVCFGISRSAFAADPPHVVMMIGEDEYKTWETLPEFARSELEPRGMRVTVILEDGKEKNYFPGLVEALGHADLLVLSTRRRLPPKDQLDAVRAYLDAGKPLVGIRTACHAFAAPLVRGQPAPVPAGSDSWPEFDPQVLGGHYVGHHGASATVTVTLAPGAGDSPLLAGVDAEKLIGNGSLYRVSPLDPSCTPLLIGTIPDKPAEPVAWTHLYGTKKARVFYTSLGHPDDFKESAFRKLLLNGVHWAMDSAAVKGPASKPAATDAIQIELLAGKHDRHDTPIVWELPEGARNWKGFRLTDAATHQPIAAQLDPGTTPRLVWVVDDLKAGGSRRYALAQATPADDVNPAVKVVRDQKSVRVEVNRKPVLQYNTAIVPSEDPKEPAYARSGFIHPLYDPAGGIVTDGMPPDHMHQHGLMFPYVDTNFEGRKVDFWNSYKHEGEVRHVELISTISGPVFGSFTATLEHVDLKAPGGSKVALRETWLVRVYRHEAGFLFDLQSIQSCAGTSPLKMNQYDYGGMTIRGAREWFPSKCEFLTSEGKNRAAGNHTRANWCAMFGSLGDHDSCVVLFGHPSNFSSPQPLRLHPDKPYFCWAPMVLGPFSIEPGKPYVSTYRCFVQTAKPNAASADALWNDLADPPAIRVLPRE